MNDSDKFYENVYLRRINRFGENTTDRLQGQREKEFENLLITSVYRVDFWFEGKFEPAILSTNQQDNSKTVYSLLTRRNIKLNNGEIYDIARKDEQPIRWMVFYQETNEPRGYNKYIVLKMTHSISWISNIDKKQYISDAYFHGKWTSDLVDYRKSPKNSSVYDEDINYHQLIMPINDKLNKDDYFDITTLEIEEHYRVTGRDIQSTPGVMFVTVEPIYKYDLTPAPVQQQQGDPEFYWLNGGNI